MKHLRITLLLAALLSLAMPYQSVAVIPLPVIEAPRVRSHLPVPRFNSAGYGRIR